MDYWPHIKGPISDILYDLKDTLTLGVVKEALDTGNAHLWIGSEGFIIWRLVSEPDGTRTFLVWFAAGHRENPVAYYEQQIRDMALDCEADAVEFRSNRRGWERVLPGHWHVSHVAYRWRLNDG